MKKGFTLIELMAVIIILGIIAIIIVPNIERGIERYRQNSYETQIRTIKMAANNFSIDNIHINSLGEGEFVYITLNQLKLSGYLDGDIVNPITNENFSGETVIKISRVGDIFEFEVIVSEEGYLNLVNISLVGDLVEYVCEYSAYVEKGARAYDSNGDSLTYSISYNNSNGTSLASLDNQSSGMYYARYTVSTADGSSTIIRTVIIGEGDCSNILTTDPSCFEVDGDTIVNYDAECGSSVVIPYVIEGETIRVIGSNAFNSKGIRSVRIPHVVNSIASYAFNNNSLDFINLPVELNNLGRNAFSNNSINSLILKGNLTTLEEEVFLNNEIASVNILNTITNISEGAFRNNNINNINISDNVETISANAFRNNKIEKLELSDNVTTLGDFAFSENFIIQNNATIDNELANVNEGTGVLNNNGESQTEDIFLVYLREYPSISFDPDGSSDWQSDNSAIININGVLITSSEYEWTTEANQPSEFTNSFSSGDTVTTPSDCGEYYLWAKVSNSFGAEVIEGSNIYRVDSQTPSAPTITGGSSSWTNENRTISISASPTCSGIDLIQYRVNGGSWQTYSNPIEFSSMGEYEIEARSRNNAGTYSLISNALVRIDKIAPTISYSPNDHSNWTNQTQYVDVTIEENGGSGIDTIRRRLSSDGGSSYGDWASRSGDFEQNLANSGVRRIQTEACDNAGNCTTLSSGIFNIDKESMSITLSPNSSGYSESVTVTPSFSSTISGLDTSSVQARISTNNGSSYGSWFNLSSPYQVNLNQKGNTVIQVRASNNAGTQTTVTSNTYQVLEDPAFTFTASIPSGDRDFGLVINTSSEVIVHWEGSQYSETSSSDRLLHTFGSGGTKNVTIYGEPSRISFCRLVEGGFIFGCDSGLTPEKVTGVSAVLPSSITSIESMFTRAENFNSPNVSSWDTSNVTNMRYAFDGNSSFNRSLNSWDVSNVEDFSMMFRNAIVFNQPLNNWNVSNGTNFSNMFNGATVFNGDIRNWDVSAASDFRNMFASAGSFNQNISSWNTSNVTNFSSMFRDASAFNRNIGGWNTSEATSIGEMFRGASSFNQNIGGWNVSNVTTFGNTFWGASSFNQDLSGWCVQHQDVKPGLFDHLADSWVLPRPVWGTCP